MNVRIEEQKLRFKISEEELGTLLDGHSIHVSVTLLNKTFKVTINPNRLNDSMEGKLVLEQSEVYLNLLVPPSEIQALSEMGRSRCGLENQIGDLSISLQVDLRGDTRKACKE